MLNTGKKENFAPPFVYLSTIRGNELAATYCRDSNLNGESYHGLLLKTCRIQIRPLTFCKALWGRSYCDCHPTSSTSAWVLPVKFCYEFNRTKFFGRVKSARLATAATESTIFHRDVLWFDELDQSIIVI
jgi:hypothetical protein